jgi:hypothetical protein
VHQDRIEWANGRGGGVDHALELGPPVIGGRGTWFDERLHQLKIPRRGEVLPLLDLIRDDNSLSAWRVVETRT